MKHTFLFLSKIYQLVLVLVGTFIAPAFAVGMFTFDPYLFVDIIRNPNYAAVMTIISIISVMYYVSWKLERVE